MEEIDIIELLKRVKEGKVPKRIEINDTVYEYIDDWDEIQEMYQQDNWQWLYDERIEFDTKIKILDEHKIEELEEKIHGTSLGDTNRTLLYTIKKINEIIRHINKGE